MALVKYLEQYRKYLALAHKGSHWLRSLRVRMVTNTRGAGLFGLLFRMGLWKEQR